MRPAIVPSSSPMHELHQGVTVVTGGAGLIGSAVIWGINNQNQENIWLVDECEDDSLKKRNLEHLCFRRILGLGEFRSLVSQNSPELSEIRTIIHLGACSSTTETDEDYLHDNNFLYTKDLCEWSLCNGVRFVYASSAATYGDGTLGMDDKDEEIEKFQPLNLYGWSKHKFDLLARNEGWLEQITGLKYFNVYGPNEEHKGDMRSVVSKAYKQIAETGRMTLFRSHRPDYRDGEQKRDFLYVKDAVLITITDCEFENNTTDRDAVCVGGALAVYNSTGEVNGTLFKDNYSEDDGGAVYASASNLDFTDCPQLAVVHGDFADCAPLAPRRFA